MTNKVIITLTTIPSRILDTIHGDDGIKSCIESLQNQNYEDYEIHFNIPYINKLTGAEYTIPDWISEYDKIKIFRTEDFGPVTKLSPTVERITDLETIIIVVDDDLVYHPDMILEHVKNQSTRDCVFGYDALDSYETKFEDIRDHFVVSVPFEVNAKVIQHYKSVSYKRKYFKEDFFKFIEENYSWSDDLLISAYMQKEKIARKVMPYDNEDKLETLEQWRNKGGVTTFPVIRHTSHGSYEGCNIFRQTNTDDNSNKLYQFINREYETA
jgi:glycosyltransferase involved in cell wall biosynthesis